MPQPAIAPDSGLRARLSGSTAVCASCCPVCSGDEGWAVKISEILWRAANEHLWDGCCELPDRKRFSCTAVSEAAVAAGDAWHGSARSFVESLLDLREVRGDYLNDIPDEEDRQGARYLWLMFAYEVAKSEGL